MLVELRAGCSAISKAAWLPMGRSELAANGLLRTPPSISAFLDDGPGGGSFRVLGPTSVAGRGDGGG
jgi:hypothetical protein